MEDACNREVPGQSVSPWSDKGRLVSIISMNGKSQLPTCIFKMVLFFLITMAGTAYADEPESTITTLHADLGTSLNPQGLMLFAGGYRRWSLGEGNPGNLSPYLQSGLALGISPAGLKRYARRSVRRW